MCIEPSKKEYEGKKEYEQRVVRQKEDAYLLMPSSLIQRAACLA